MAENTYLCHQCGNIFRLSLASEATCPQCGSSQTRELPSWVPMGSNLSESQTKWQCEYQQCKHKFEIPVPDSPSGEKNIRCPACNGRHIHRLTPSGRELLYCG